MKKWWNGLSCELRVILLIPMVFIVAVMVFILLNGLMCMYLHGKGAL